MTPRVSTARGNRQAGVKQTLAHELDDIWRRPRAGGFAHPDLHRAHLAAPRAVIMLTKLLTRPHEKDHRARSQSGLQLARIPPWVFIASN